MIRKLTLACLLMLGCGQQSTVRTTEPVAERIAPRCSADEPNQPYNASAKLREFKEALSRCLLLGEQAKGPTTLVFVLQVAEDGKVRESAVAEGSVNTDAAACVEKATGALQFDPFCGDDVEVRWRIGVE
jgi:hypothetical protein